MCTLCKKNEAKVASKPIKCFKVVRRYKGIDYRYTGIIDKRIPTECFENSETPFVAEGREEITLLGNYTMSKYSEMFNYGIGRGFIHCFDRKRDAVSAIKILNFRKRGDVTYEVWKCEVPASAAYFKGINSWSGSNNAPLDGMPTIAASSIFFKKLVYTNKK